MTCFRSIGVFVSILILSSPIYGQVAAVPELGANLNQSYSGGAFDHVELQNGNLYADIPVISFPQLGKLGLSFSLRTNNKPSSLTATCDAQGDCILAYSTPSGPDSCTGGDNVGNNPEEIGVSLIMDQALDFCKADQDRPYTYAVWAGAPNVTEDAVWTTYTVIDSSLALHEMGFDAANTQILHDNNGLGYSMNIPAAWVSPESPGAETPPPVIVESNGTTHQTNTTTNVSGEVVSETTTITDTNGNSINHVGQAAWIPNQPLYGYIDSIGRHIPDPNNLDQLPSASLSLCPNLQVANEPVIRAVQWQIPGPNGTPNTYIFCYTQISIATDFFGNGPGAANSDEVLCTNPEEGGSDTCWITEIEGSASDVPVLQSLVLPNHTFWGFKYSTVSTATPTAYGELTDIIYPTGGNIHYNNSTIQACGNPALGEYWPLQRVVQERIETPQVGPAMATSYDYQPTSTTVTDADGNDEVHHFTLDYPTSYYCGAAETSTQWYQGARTAGNLLREKDTQYTGTPDPQAVDFPQGGAISTYAPIINRRPTSDVTLQNGVTVETHTYAYDAWYADAQPFTDESGGGVGFGAMPQNSQIYLATPTTVDDTIKEVVTQRYASDHSAYAAANLVNLPETVTTYEDATGAKAAQTTYAYDESGSPSGVHGNQTSAHHWLNTASSQWVISSATYNNQGMPTDTYDANLNAGLTNGNHVHTTYDSTGIFPASTQASTTAGVQHVDYYIYDNATGFMMSHTDQNGSGAGDAAHTTTYAYDNMGRLTTVTDPPTSAGQGGTTYCYVDHNQSSSCPGSTDNTIYATTLAAPDPNIVQSTSFDGIGRRVKAVDGSGDTVDTSYDDRGNVYQTTNPYIGTPNGTTSFTYDGLQRKTLQTQPDGTPLVWSYSGNNTTSTDEALNSWQRISDVAGRLVQVIEPGGLKTTYSYDALNNLKCVDQWGTAAVGAPCSSSKMRSFQYDSFARLLWAQNPETGVVCYGQGDGTVAGCQTNGYDPNGNLLYKTDARGVVSSYTYDALNRITSKSSNDGITRYQEYIYDGSDGVGWSTPSAFLPNAIGRLSHTSDDTHIASFLGYDAMGRLTLKADCLQTDCSYSDTQSATYDLAGNMTSLTYPDGRIVDQVFDGAGRLAKVSNRAAGSTPAFDFVYGSNTLSNPGDTTTGGIQYTAAGAPQSFVLGNGVGQFNGYNSRLQPCHTMASTPVLGGTVSALLNGTGPGNLLDRESFYSSATSACGPEAGSNGNIHSITDKLQVGNTQSFSYDSLNRLSTAWRSDGAYNHTYNYDSFGNMLLHDNLAPASSVAWSIDQTTNRLLRSHNGGVTWGDNSYDASGNLQSTSDGISPVSYQYNANNQVLSINSGQTASYLYDAMDQRVFKQTSSGTTPGTTDYIYFNNQPIAEKDQNNHWTDYIYANGQKIASVADQQNVFRIQGLNTAAGQYTWFYMPMPSDITSYVIQPGDLLVFKQRTHGLAQGGISFNTDTYGNPSFQTISIAHDRDGDVINEDPWTKDTWHNRVVPIDLVAGNHVSVFTYGCDGNASAGAWYIDFADVAIVSTSTGAVHPIFTGTQSVTATPYYPFVNSDPSQALAGVQSVAATDVPRYYLDDHLGTAQMELSAGGWPVWEGQFMPFGQEIVNAAPLLPGQPDGSSMHYKFTGKERDTESGLDYFGARYYASNMGRFMSPDWSDAPDTIPYGDLSNPQSLNLYSYVNNNPLSKTDDDGHVPCGGTASITITVTPNGSSMSQSADDCPTLGFIDTLLFYRQRFINRVNANADAHKPPPQPNNKGQALQDLNNIMMGAVPVGASARFGWKNGAKWRQAVKDLMKPGTHESIAGEVPTRAEASEMIEQSGGKISRGGEGDPNMDDGEKFGHPEGGVSDHNYPHINYETPSGVKATVKVQ